MPGPAPRGGGGLERGKKKEKPTGGRRTDPPPHSPHTDLSRPLRGVTAGCPAWGDGTPPNLRSSLTSMYFLRGVGGGANVPRDGSAAP